MKMEREQIKNELENIIFLKTGNRLTKSLLDENFLSVKFNMQPRDLVYLLYLVEDYFKITIPETHIVSNRFASFNAVVDIIYELQ